MQKSNNNMLVLTSLTSLFTLYPKGHRPMRKIHVESFYIHHD